VSTPPLPPSSRDGGVEPDTGTDQPRTVSSRVVHENAWMSLRDDRIRRADGSPGVYAYVDKPASALVIPVDNGGFHLIEQHRYPIRRRSLEFPQGTYPDRRDGDPAELARQELQEETGLRAGRLDHLGRLFVGPGLTNQAFHVFVASDLTAGPHDRETEELDMTQTWVTATELEGLILDGDIVDGPTVAAYALLQLHARRAGQSPGDAGAGPRPR
jgi:8-oxo-dGDP phosphatase